MEFCIFRPGAGGFIGRLPSIISAFWNSSSGRRILQQWQSARSHLRITNFLTYWKHRTIVWRHVITRQRLARELTSSDVVCFCAVFVRYITISRQSGRLRTVVLSQVMAANNAAGDNACSISLCCLLFKDDALACWIRLLRSTFKATS